MPRIGRLAATLVASAVVSGAAVAYRDAAIGVASFLEHGPGRATFTGR